MTISTIGEFVTLVLKIAGIGGISLGILLILWGVLRGEKQWAKVGFVVCLLVVIFGLAAWFIDRFSFCCVGPDQYSLPIIAN